MRGSTARWSTFFCDLPDQVFFIKNKIITMTQLPENPHSAKIQSTTKLSGDEVSTDLRTSVDCPFFSSVNIVKKGHVFYTDTC